MKILFLILLSLLPLKGVSFQNQNEGSYFHYYKTIYRADSLMLNKNYSTCYKLLDSLFHKKKALNHPPYYEYKTYSNI